MLGLNCIVDKLFTTTVTFNNDQPRLNSKFFKNSDKNSNCVKNSTIMRLLECPIVLDLALTQIFLRITEFPELAYFNHVELNSLRGKYSTVTACTSQSPKKAKIKIYSTKHKALLNFDPQSSQIA